MEKIVDEKNDNIHTEGSSKIVENQMPVGSVVTFFFFFNYLTKDKILVFVHRQMSTLL